MAKDPVRSIEKILGDADALIRRRLQAVGLEAQHVVVAMTPDGVGIIRSNVAPGALTGMALMLRAVAAEAESPPADDDTRH